MSENSPANNLPSDTRRRVELWPLWVLLAALIVMNSLGYSSLSIWHWIVVGVVVFIPTFVAGRRGHRNAIAVFVLNLVVYFMVLLASAFDIEVVFSSIWGG